MLYEQLYIKPKKRDNLHGGIPVSYTHLDVYKRQLLDEGLKSRLILQVHDELLIETKEAEKDKDVYKRQGLNLPVRRIVFLEVEKFDGVSRRPLVISEIKQTIRMHFLWLTSYISEEYTISVSYTHLQAG